MFVPSPAGGARGKGRKPSAAPSEEDEKKRVAAAHAASVILSSEIRLGDIIGKGNFGIVYLGRCRGTDVAVKELLKPTAEMSAKQLDNFVKEIAAMSAMHHDNIIRIMGASTDGDKCQMVMELMDGNLEEVLLKSTEGKRMSLYDRLMLARQAVMGLRWMHFSTPALIHSDLKLENIMYKKVGGGYRVKLADLGLSVFQHDKEHELNYRNYRGGTPYTQAPEIWKAKPFDTKSDVYSLALCIWGMCSSQPLFPEHDDVDVFSRAIRSGLRPAIPDSWPKALRKLLEKMWKDDPAKRPDIAKVGWMLDDILIELAIGFPDGRKFWKECFETPVPVDWPSFLDELAVHLDWHFEASSSTDLLKLKCLEKLLKQHDEVSLLDFGHFCNRFGPLLRRDGTSIIDNVYDLLKEPWFHGPISDENMVLLFKKEENKIGSFLIRYSAQLSGAFTVVRKAGPDSFTRFRVTNTEKGYNPQDPPTPSAGPASALFYPSLSDFVLAYTKSLGLNEAIGGSEFESIFMQSVVDLSAGHKEEGDGYDPLMECTIDKKL